LQVRQNLQVVVVADDPIEAGMLALDVVQFGVATQAVRDAAACLQQLEELARARPDAAVVVVSAHRDLEASAQLWQTLQPTTRVPAFAVVTLRSQRDAAEKMAQEAGWAGVAVRPVNVEELVGIVVAATARAQAQSDAHVKQGDLAQEPLVEVLGSLVDRVPRPGSGKSAVVSVESLGRNGIVVVTDGELTHAGCDGEVGRHVLERMCCWTQGTFRIEPGALLAPPSLSGSSLGLLAVAQEYARRIDEARQNLPYTDCVCTVRWERVRPLPVVAEALFRRIASGMVLADALPGEGDDELEAFAALETRIKRGAVVPQIERAPPLQSAAAADTDAAALAARMPSDPGSGALLPRSSAASPAVPMTLVDAPQVPQRRRSHPTTHIYRVGDSARISDLHGPAPDAPNDLPGDVPPPQRDTNQPPALPRRVTGPVTQSGTVLTGGDAGGTSGTRRDRSTGWFGVAVGQGRADAAPPAQDVPLGAARPTQGLLSTRISEGLPPVGAPPPSARITEGFNTLPVTPGAAARISQGLSAAPDASVRADGIARPYSWMPAAAVDDEPADDPSEPSALIPPKKQRWPWFAAAGLLIATLLVVLWPVPDPAVPGAPDLATPSQRAYRRAVQLIDAGADREAMSTLETLVGSHDFQAEALIHLAVLEAQAGKYDAARKHLEAYIAHPDALHRGRARKLHKHLFGATLAPPPIQTGQTMQTVQALGPRP
jgi:CheY-like chemotaxis protein